VTVDITSPSAGVIKSYFAAEGDTVAVGSNFFEIDTDGKPGAAAPKQTPAPPKVSTSAWHSVEPPTQVLNTN